MEKERPRLSGALRAFSSISRPDIICGKNKFSSDPSALAEKLKKQRNFNESNQSSIGWSMLNVQLYENCHKQDVSKVCNDLILVIMLFIGLVIADTISIKRFIGSLKGADWD